MDKKDLHWKIGRTEILVSGVNLDLLKKSEKDPCTNCLTGMGRNEIFCEDCLPWRHKNCSGSKAHIVQ